MIDEGEAGLQIVELVGFLVVGAALEQVSRDRRHDPGTKAPVCTVRASGGAAASGGLSRGDERQLDGLHLLNACGMREHEASALHREGAIH